MTDLRVGVVGLGLRKTLAVEIHRPGRGARVVAVCDTDQRALDWATTTFGSSTTTVTQFDDLLSQRIDAVMVLTPDQTHAEFAHRALAAGITTFCEKPLAITTEDCDALLEQAYRTETRLYVGHNMRHMPVIRTMRHLISDGAIGAIEAIWCRHFVGHGGDFYFKDWHADRRNTTGLLLQKGAHDIDVIHWLSHSVTRHVTAMGKLSVYNQISDRVADGDDRPADWFAPEQNWPPLSQTGLNPVIDVEDLSMMLMQLDNGILASYQQCHYTPDYWRNYTVIGSAGRIENFGDMGENTVVKVWNRGRRGFDPDADLTIPVPIAASGHGGADAALVDEFLRFITYGGGTDTSPVAARDAVAAGTAATTSLRNDSSLETITPVRAGLAEYFAAGQPSRHIG